MHKKCCWVLLIRPCGPGSTRWIDVSEPWIRRTGWVLGSPGSARPQGWVLGFLGPPDLRVGSLVSWVRQTSGLGPRSPGSARPQGWVLGFPGSARPQGWVLGLLGPPDLRVGSSVSWVRPSSGFGPHELGSLARMARHVPGVKGCLRWRGPSETAGLQPMY